MQVDANDQRIIVIFLSTGFSLAEAGRVMALFNLANRLQIFYAAYTLRFLSADGGPLQSSTGVQVATDALSDGHGRHAYAFFHLHGDSAPAAWNEDVLRHLSEIEANARMIVGGVNFPANGASKWTPAHDDAVRISAPSAQDTTPVSGIRKDVFDAAMSLVESDLGEPAAREIARILSRSADAQFVQSVWAVRELSASPSIRASVQRLRNDSTGRISVANAARAVAMSERNFLRRFKSEIGVTPTEFVLNLRLERACHMLIHTTLPADKIARRAGLGSGERLAKLFRQRLAMSPTEYRTAERERISKVGVCLAYATDADQPCGMVS
jgi:transcriptional regulator GlxA family with amidase domain